MPDITASIRRKGLETTGVTEELASKMFHNVGGYYMAIVELKVKQPHGPDDEGQCKVDLVLTQVEPATSESLDAHLRELTRTLDFSRRLTAIDAQLTIDTREDLEPTVEAVTAAGMRFKPHLFVASDLPGETGVCDACGEPASYGAHKVDDHTEVATDEQTTDAPKVDA